MKYLELMKLIREYGTACFHDGADEASRSKSEYAKHQAELYDQISTEILKLKKPGTTLGSSTSEAKAKSSAENGKLGGRPQKEYRKIMASIKTLDRIRESAIAAGLRFEEIEEPGRRIGPNGRMLRPVIVHRNDLDAFKEMAKTRR